MRGQVDFLWEVGPDVGRVPQRSHRGRGPVVPRLLRLRADAQLRAAAVPPPGRPARASTWPSTGRSSCSRPSRAAASRPTARSGRTTGPAIRARRRPPSTRRKPAPCCGAARQGPDRVHVPGPGEFLDPRTHGAARAAATGRDRRPHAAGIAAARRVQPAHRLGAVRRGDDLPILGGPYATMFHRFWHSPGETKRWNFWGYRNAARRRGARRGARAPATTGVPRGHPAVRDGGARRSAGGLPRLEPDGAGRQPPLRRAGGGRRARRHATCSTAGGSASPGARRSEDPARPLRGDAGHGGRRAAADLRRGVGVLPARGHAAHRDGRQPERRAPGRRADPPLHLDQPADPAGAGRRPRRHRPERRCSRIGSSRTTCCASPSSAN